MSGTERMGESSSAMQVAQATRPALVTIGVVGTGSIGSRHIRVLQSLRGVQAIAVPRRAERVAQWHAQGYRAAATLQEAIGQGASGVVIATDTGRHRDDALAALEAGLDVLVEKPLAVDAAQAREIARRAQALGRRLAVGCVMRFAESLTTVRRLLPRIGPVHRVAIACQSYLPDWRPQRPYREGYSARAEDGGVLRDLVHEIDYAGWLFGWPDAVQARLRNLGRLGIAAEEAADLWWQTGEGAVVSITLDYLSRPPRRRLHAVGERGTLEWDGVGGVVILEPVDAAAEVLRSSQARDEAFAAQAAAFFLADDGWDPRLATGEEGVRALAVIDAARRASVHGGTEPVARA